MYDDGTCKGRMVSPRGVRGSIVPPGNLPGRPPISPHHALVVYFPQLSELLHEVIDVFPSERWRVGVRRGPLNEGVRSRFGQIILSRCSVPQPHEKKLWVKPLQCMA